MSIPTAPPRTARYTITRQPDGSVTADSASGHVAATYDATRPEDTITIGADAGEFTLSLADAAELAPLLRAVLDEVDPSGVNRLPARSCDAAIDASIKRRARVALEQFPLATIREQANSDPEVWKRDDDEQAVWEMALVLAEQGVA